MQAAQAVSEYEAERGKPMPSKNHGLVQVYLGAAFLRYERQYSIIAELTLALNGNELTPDLCVYPRLPTDWRHDDVRMTEPPLMVVEILSPRQTMDDLIRKADAYFAGGVKSCWIVQPMLELITVLQPGAKPITCSGGELSDPATGIAVRIEEIFRA